MKALQCQEREPELHFGGLREGSLIHKVQAQCLGPTILLGTHKNVLSAFKVGKER